MSSPTTSSPIQGKVLFASRIVDAPRERVFGAFADPKSLARWWGPNGFTNTFPVFEFRNGGSWNFLMHGPNGVNYPNESVFVEIIKPEKIVIDHVSEPKFVLTVTLNDINGKTKVDWHQEFQSAEIAAKVAPIAVDGNEQNLDRLEAELNEKDAFVIERTVEAPRDRVFRAWTNPEELKKWLAPKGFQMTTCSMDFRPGGSFHYAQRSPDGKEMWGKWQFREIVAPEKIVLLQWFSDKDGGLTRHPMAPNWPQKTLSVTRLTEKDGKTKISIHWSPYNASEDEKKIFQSANAGMTQGWTGTFAHLDEYLAGKRS